MAQSSQEVTPITIEYELKKSYLDYAMSVIVGRALPDVRDGLKPVHRRTLFAMRELGNDYNKPYKKSARIVGDVIGKYHPHGDTAVYDTIVRMAQDFSLRYLLVDGQGNFGSVDGDSAAAMRYTEIRLTRLAHAMLADLDKETVDFAPNYDETEQIPTVLPARIPNLLINGSSGIAVGMATNIPPHNLIEVISGCSALIDNPELSINELMEFIPGPDFPTAGIINGRAGIMMAYQTGRGRIYLRARATVEELKHNAKMAIVVTELPYQVNKAKLQEKIAELVKEKRLEGITAIRDESDKQGMRLVIECRRGENGEVILNQLYKLTQMQVVFGINIVALDQGQPKVLNLKQLLQAFIKHRQEVVTRRTVYLLRKARARAHILEGLGIALANIDGMIALIKASKNPPEAKAQLLTKTWAAEHVAVMLAGADNSSRPEGLPIEFGLVGEGYRLTAEQAQAILDLRLHRLTGLEQDKMLKEYQEILTEIKALLLILGSTAELMRIIEAELLEAQTQFGDQRRTEIIDSEADLSIEDLTPNEPVVVTRSHEGYVKSQTLDVYQAQRRGGRGKAATAVKEADFVEHLITCNAHDTILCFSSIGKLYWLKAYRIPQASRTSRGRPIVNLLPLSEHEKITAILPVKEFTEDRFVFMATQKGTVKKVALSQFARPRANGIIALDLNADDRLVGADLTDGSNEIMLFSDTGKVVRFNEAGVRTTGRTARGVRGIRLSADQKVVSLVIVKEDAAILTATENGYGKRTEVQAYRETKRGGQGVISIQVSARNGKVIGALEVQQEDEIMLISGGGTLVRTRVNEVSIVGRNTQGVRLINLGKGERLIGLQRIAESDEAEGGE